MAPWPGSPAAADPAAQVLGAYGGFMEQETQRSLLKQTPRPSPGPGTRMLPLPARASLCGCGAVLLPEASFLLWLLAGAVPGRAVSEGFALGVGHTCLKTQRKNLVPPTSRPDTAPRVLPDRPPLNASRAGGRPLRRRHVCPERCGLFMRNGRPG